MTSWLAKVESIRRSYGLGLGAVYVMNLVAERCGGREWIFPYSLVSQASDDIPVLTGRRRNALSWRLVERGDPLLAGTRPPAVVEQRFAQGAVCLWAFCNDVPVGFAWFATSRYQEDEVRCDFRFEGPGIVWDFDVHVLERWRSTFGFAYLWTCVSEYFASSGIRASLSRISRFKLDSLGSHARLGAKEFGRLWFLRIGSVQLLLSRRRPWLHVSFRDRDRPIVHLA